MTEFSSPLLPIARTSVPPPVKCTSPDAVSFPVFQILNQLDLQKKAQVLCVIDGKLPLFFHEAECLVSKIIFPVVGKHLKK